MEVTLAAVADHASQTSEGKLNISGIFQILNSQRAPLPIMLPMFYFVVQIVAETSELTTATAAHIEVELPGGQRLPVAHAEVDPRSIEVTYPEAGISINLILPLVGFSFHLPGAYVFRNILGNGEVGRAQIYVLPQLEEAE